MRRQGLVRLIQSLCNPSNKKIERCLSRKCSIQSVSQERSIIQSYTPPLILPTDPPPSPFYENPHLSKRIPSIENEEERQMAERRMAVRSKIREIEARTGKIPFVDSYARVHNYLRISLTETCNFSCNYCMPSGGVSHHSKKDLMSNEEIIILARIFARRGINKIRLTGGEPTLRKDLHLLIEELKKLDGVDDIGITTNGLILQRQLTQLKTAGLDKINISLDTLIPRRFEKMTKVFGFEKVRGAIDATEKAYGRVKINVVVIRGFNTDELSSFVQQTKDRNWDVRFIEFMPFGGNEFNDEKFIGYQDQLDIIRKEFGDQIVRLNDSPNDTSKAYKIPGYLGQFGFISSMSDNFCSTCNRIRLTANGNLKVCLHSNHEVSLLDQLRNGKTEEEVETLIEKTLWKKRAEHAGPLLPSIQSKAFLLSIIPSSSSILSLRYHHTQIPNANQLSHVDGNGSANQVDVSSKSPSKRSATAQAIIQVTQPIFKAIVENNLKKGDVLSVANIASIQAAKKTSDLIPLCHNIPISHCETKFRLDESKHWIEIECQVSTISETGVEMEALTAVSIAALTIYDMTKAISQEMTIHSIHLLSKSGGKRDFLKN